MSSVSAPLAPEHRLARLITLVIVAALAGPACGHQPWAGAGSEGPRARPNDWHVVTSDHFIVRTDADAAHFDPVIERLEDVHEALSRTFFAGVPLPPIDVLLFARQSDFEAVAPENLVGFFTPQAHGLPDGLLVFSSEAREFDAVASTAAHELAHRFLVAVSERVPTWLHEGFARYVGASQILGDLVVFDAKSPPELGFSARVPLGRLLATSSSDFHGADARNQYLSAWMLVRQLLRDPRPASIARLQKLFALSGIAPSPQAAAAAVSEAFGGLPVADIERALGASYQDQESGAPARATLAVTLRRTGRTPAQVAAAARAQIRDLCAELRARHRP